MEVLLVGSDGPVGEALQSVFAQWGRHRARPVSLSASRWRSERQAKKAARKGDPEAIVDLRIAELIAADEAPDDDDLERAHWLAKACERSGIRYLLLSSDRVFAGTQARGLRETDEPDGAGIAERIAEVEQRILQASSGALVLRTGPIFADIQSNLLTRTLAVLARDRSASFDDSDVFCPVANIDVARVLAAMLDQLSVGSPAAGIYHYCSGDRTTEYGFAEASLAAASQFVDSGDVTISATAGTGNPISRVLDCSRLRDTFAVKQVPWRGFINPVVKQYVERLRGAEKP